MFGFERRNRGAEQAKQQEAEKQKKALDFVFNVIDQAEVALAMINYDKRLAGQQEHSRIDPREEDATYTKEVGRLLEDLLEKGNQTEKNLNKAYALIEAFLRQHSENVTQKEIEAFIQTAQVRAREELAAALETGAIELA